MPAALSYPGVYIEEIPSGVRTITGVPTSIAAFVGRALRGPVNEPITINSYADFERRFGGLWATSALGYAVRDFYLNGGAQGIIVRVYSPLFKDDAARQAALAAATAQAQTAADAVEKAAKDAAAVAAPPPTVNDIVTAVNNSVNAASAPGAAAAAAANAVAQAVKTAAAAQGATVANVVAAATAAKAAAVTTAANAAAPVTRAQLPTNNLVLEAAYEGAWGNNLRARVDTDVSQDVADRFHLDKSKLFNLSVRDTDADITEVFRNVTVDESPRQVARLLKNESKLVRVQTPPGVLPTAHDDPQPGDDIWAKDNLSSKVTIPASNGNQLAQADFTGKGTSDAKHGLYALKDADIFNLLCIPPHVPDGSIEQQLIDDAVSFCEERRAMMIIDPPDTWIDKDAAKNGVGTDIGSPSKNAVVYFPRLKQPNPLHENQVEIFAPCGVLAGVFARTDTARGVWKAPAGLDATLVGVPELAVLLTDLENGELNKLGVNCLRTLPAAGRVVWGARTRRGDDRLADEWKYIPVRRTALYIEESLYRGTQWVVFEPNDEPLWAEIRLNVGAFMQGLFRQGAFQGSTPREAYFVKCDRETTTQDDINLGIVNIVVGFAPLKPAEFVVIKLQQMAGQIQA
jgi:phage tail sheath protein FI